MSRILPKYAEDVLTERAGVLPAVLFGAGSSGAIALLFPSSRPYVIYSAVFGGMIGAAFALAVEHRSERKVRRAMAADPGALAPATHQTSGIYDDLRKAAWTDIREAACFLHGEYWDEVLGECVGCFCEPGSTARPVYDAFGRHRGCGCRPT